MANQITILNNKTCKLSTDNMDLRSIIYASLSFKLNGVEYTQAYQNGWDGKTYLLTKKNEFPSGLLNTVQQIIKDNGQEVSIVDNRNPITNAAPLDISAKLTILGKIPRDYQTDVLNAALANRKGIIRACTGAGKTLCMAMVTAALNKPTIIFVIGIDLLKQIHDFFSSIFDEPIGFVGNGVCDIHRINIVSIWTVGKALNIKDIVFDADEMEKEDFNKENEVLIKEMLKKTPIHLFDECHTITCDTVRSLVKYIDPERIFGFSGTPFRDDNSDLLITGILGEKIIDISASKLIEQGVLIQPIIKFLSVPYMSAGTKKYQEVYKEYIVENNVRNKMIVSSTKSLIEKGYSPLVLFKQIKHGKILSELFDETGIKYTMLYGNDTLEKRTQVKQDFIDKKIDVILASTIFDLGIDLPSISALVLCGGGRSSIRCLQRIGRAIRYFDGKKQVAVVDFYDQIKFLKGHSKIRYNVYKSENGFKILPSKEMV
jgi:superfamily II DNA or RNA helicase